MGQQERRPDFIFGTTDGCSSWSCEEQQQCILLRGHESFRQEASSKDQPPAPENGKEPAEESKDGAKATGEDTPGDKPPPSNNMVTSNLTEGTEVSAFYDADGNNLEPKTPWDMMSVGSVGTAGTSQMLKNAMARQIIALEAQVAQLKTGTTATIPVMPSQTGAAAITLVQDADDPDMTTEGAAEAPPAP